jgi:transposase
MLDETRREEYAQPRAKPLRLSIPPEFLLRATLLQAFFTVRSERQLMEQIDYKLLFRWFVDLSMDDAVGGHSSFSTNWGQLLEAGVAHEFLSCLLALPKVKPLLSSDHFTVEEAFMKAWASLKRSGRRTGVMAALRATGAMASATSAGRSSRTRPMKAGLTPRPGSAARVTARRAGCATWAMSGGLVQLKPRVFGFAILADNLVRVPKLLAAAS